MGQDAFREACFTIGLRLARPAWFGVGLELVLSLLWVGVACLLALRVGFGWVWGLFEGLVAFLLAAHSLVCLPERSENKSRGGDTVSS